jgi:1,2-diacylglycerol 3-beta-glucosyltransferase
VNLPDLLLALVGVAVALPSAYLLLLTLLSARLRPPVYEAPKHRFRIVVPAHNEALGIAESVRNLLALDYPRELYDVFVVADNCSDDTAPLAQAAGAKVLVRVDEQLRGKGYALRYAFEGLPADVDAVVVVDADTLVSPNLLRAFSARLALGAHAVQADYAVRNPDAAWRTRLMAIAFGSFHIVRSRGRERLRVSCGLRGNGMCFSRAVLSAVPHDAFSIVEDVEYGIRLGEAGYRVHYADEAHVFGEMVASEAASRSQRKRWEAGRAGLTRAHALRLLKSALSRRDRVLLDLAIDVLIPPLSRLALAIVTGLVAVAVGSLLWGGFALSAAVWGFCAWVLLIYVLRGWSVSKTGLKGLLDLAFAPAYMVWKLSLRVRSAKAGRAEWVRTTRENAGSKPAVE